jgi:hypothetical protein
VIDDALDILAGVGALVGVLLVALWVIRAADYFSRRESTVELVTPRESFWDVFQVVLLVLGLVGLFFVFWLFKRMWGPAA